MSSLDLVLIFFLLRVVLSYRGQRWVLYPRFIFCTIHDVYNQQPVTNSAQTGRKVARVTVLPSGGGYGGPRARAIPKRGIRFRHR